MVSLLVACVTQNRPSSGVAAPRGVFVNVFTRPVVSPNINTTYYTSCILVSLFSTSCNFGLYFLSLSRASGHTSDRHHRACLNSVQRAWGRAERNEVACGHWFRSCVNKTYLGRACLTSLPRAWERAERNAAARVFGSLGPRRILVLASWISTNGIIYLHLTATANWGRLLLSSVLFIYIKWDAVSFRSVRPFGLPKANKSVQRCVVFLATVVVVFFGFPRGPLNLFVFNKSAPFHVFLFLFYHPIHYFRTSSFLSPSNS